jgi:hypothetical protein
MSTATIPSLRRLNGWPDECCVMVSTTPPGINRVVVLMCRTPYSSAPQLISHRALDSRVDLTSKRAEVDRLGEEPSPFLHRAKHPSLSEMIEAPAPRQIADMSASEPDSPIAKFGHARTLINVPMLKEVSSPVSLSASAVRRSAIGSSPRLKALRSALSLRK